MVHPQSSKFINPSPGQAGFTLVELLTVISIIVILSAISMKLVDTVQAQSREGRAKSDLDALGLALEQFVITNGTYPKFFDDNPDLSDYDDKRGFPDEKKSSETLFLALAGFLNENGELIDSRDKSDDGTRPTGYINIADFKLGSDGPPSDLRKQMRNLSSSIPRKPDGVYLIDPWREPYLYKFPVLSDHAKTNIRSRSDYILLSKGPDKKISSGAKSEYNSKTWLSDQDAGLNLDDNNYENIDNLIQGPSPSG